MHEISQAYVKVSFGHVGGFHLGDFYVCPRRGKGGPMTLEHELLKTRWPHHSTSKMGKSLHLEHVGGGLEREDLALTS